MRLRIVAGALKDETVEVKGDRITIGRDGHNDLELPDAKASREHAVIEERPSGEWVLRDLGSSNGTWIGETRIDKERVIYEGDEIRIGGHRLRVEDASSRSSTTALAQPARPRGITTFVRTAERRARRTLIASAVAVAIALTVAVLAVAGVFSGSSSEASIPSLIKQAEPSTVLVLSQVNGQRVGNGTGWVLDASRGEIVTNGHVAEYGNELSVAIGGQTRPAALVGMNRCEDVALLRVSDTSGLKAIALGRQSDLSVGDKAIAIGYPKTLATDDNLVATSGIVSVTKTHVGPFPNVLQTDAAINHGNSGGPLINDHGQLIGMNTLGSVDAQNQGFAVGVDRIVQLMPDLRSGKSTGWPGLYLDFSDYEGQEIKPLVTTDSGKELFGPFIFPKKTTHIDGITGPTDELNQFVVAIDGKYFGPNPGQIALNQEGVCDAVGDLTSGKRAHFTVLDLPTEGSTVQPALHDVSVPFQ